MTFPAGTSVPSPRNTAVAEPRAGHEHGAFPISQRSPTVAPMTRQRCPNTHAPPDVVGIVGLPMTTEFSSTADPVPTSTPAPWERTTAPWASNDPSPRRGVPRTTAEPAICGSPTPPSTVTSGMAINSHSEKGTLMTLPQCPSIDDASHERVRASGGETTNDAVAAVIQDVRVSMCATSARHGTRQQRTIRTTHGAQCERVCRRHAETRVRGVRWTLAPCPVKETS